MKFYTYKLDQNNNVLRDKELTQGDIIPPIEYTIMKEDSVKGCSIVTTFQTQSLGEDPFRGPLVFKTTVTKDGMEVYSLLSPCNQSSKDAQAQAIEHVALFY